GGDSQPNYSGVSLQPGATAWSVASDRNLKENVAQVDAEGVLGRLASLPISTWNLKQQDASIRHMGPMAQDFRAAFGLGETALGIAWVLDGLEVTLAGAVAGALKASPSLRLTDAQIGISASAYLAGAVFGALLFGWLTDRFGRKRLFFVTLGVYILATGATALSTDFATFALFRFMTGAGIGGEYSAINSAIQELIPARYRGRTDLGVNGSFWVGAALGAIGSSVLLQPGRLPPDIGWRLAFGLGAVLGVGILFLRRYLPESPRWLLLHGRTEEAESVAVAVERDVRGRITASQL